MANLSKYHEEKKKQGIKMRLKFAHTYNNLLRERKKKGRTFHGVKIQAATLAGFGNGSWSEAAAHKTRRVMASRMMSDEIVIAELKRLGLKPHPTQLNEWVIADEDDRQIDIEEWLPG